MSVELLLSNPLSVCLHVYACILVLSLCARQVCGKCKCSLQYLGVLKKDGSVRQRIYAGIIIQYYD